MGEDGGDYGMTGRRHSRQFTAASFAQGYGSPRATDATDHAGLVARENEE